MKQSNSSLVNFRDEATVEQPIYLNDLAIDMPSERVFKDSGAMIAPCTIARTGIMSYRAKECGALFADHDPMAVIKIATLEEDLFCTDSLESYRSAPITIEHPDESVTIDNASDLQKGNLDSIPFQDGDSLAGTIVLNDADTIELVNDGISQLSSGHACILVLTDFETTGCHAKKTMIRANHIAIVEAGRAGSAKIADAAISYDQNHVDGMQAIIDGLTAKLEDAASKITLGDTALLAEQEKFNDAAIDALVTTRLAFVQVCATLSDCDVTGMPVLTAKRAILADTLGKDLADKSDSYIEVRFDVLLEDADEESPMSRELSKQAKVVVKDTITPVPSKADAARLNMINRNSSK